MLEPEADPEGSLASTSAAGESPSAPLAKGVGALRVPPPEPPPAGYVRAAVVQLDFHAAAVIQNVHLLEQPPVAPKTKEWPNWFGTEFNSTLQRLRDWKKEVARELRGLYSRYHQKRLEEILRTCSEWGVQLVVLPEYSVPPECLSVLLAFTRNMTVVFGTHTVEARMLDAGEYERFGCPAPQARTAVAPIAVDGAMRAFQPKLTQNWLEAGLVVGTAWDVVQLERHQTSLGILICLDFIHRDAVHHRDHVRDGLERCGLLAVPSLTPYHTVPEFDARAQMDANRYGLPVLYADIAAGGGTSIYVDSVLEKQNGFFPYSVPSLEKDEEGVVIADIDVVMTEVSGRVSRRFQERAAVIPVAASILQYREAKRDAERLAALDEIFGQCDLTSRADLSRTITTNAARLAEIASTSSPTLQKKLNALVDCHEYAGRAEDILLYLRDVVLPDDVYPLQAVDAVRLRAAQERARAVTPTKEERTAFRAMLDRLDDLCEEVDL